MASFCYKSPLKHSIALSPGILSFFSASFLGESKDTIIVDILQDFLFSDQPRINVGHLLIIFSLGVFYGSWPIHAVSCSSHVYELD